MYKEVLEENIYYYKNLINSPAEFIKRIESASVNLNSQNQLSPWMPWVSSTRPDDIFGTFKSGSIQNKLNQTENDLEASYILETIYDAILMCIEDYSISLQKDLGVFPDEITIRKYYPGGQMGPHIDCEQDDEEARLTASLVLYLNDDFDGGLVSFSEQNISIKPEPGSLLIFPSTKPYYHASSMIVSGNKYMCPGFMYKRSKVV